MKKDWVQELFIRHGDLYIKFLEERIARAEGEVQGLIKVFEEFGIKEGSRILDLCCGIGRHAVQLAKRGYKVTGVDISPMFIEKAKGLSKAQGVKVDFKAGDICKLKDLFASKKHEKFDAIINLFTSFGYYDDQTNEDILKQCRDLMHRKGIFVMETANRDWLVRNFQRRGFAKVGDLLILEERNLVLETSRMNNIWTFLKERSDGYYKVAEIKLDLKIYSLHDLVELFARTGWKYLKAYGNLELAKLTIDSNRLIVVALSRS